MKPKTNSVVQFAIALAICALVADSAPAAPKIILVSLDGATPRFVQQYLASGDLPSNKGLGLLQSKGFSAQINETVSPSLTAVGHIAIATGSKAAKNDVVANTYHLVASPFNLNISGFGAPIGGYCIDCGAGGGPAASARPTAEPIWERLRLRGGKKVITATWPGGDGIDVRVPGASNNAIVQPAAERTVDYTVPFGAFAGAGARGFSLTAADFGPASTQTATQLAAAGKVSFSPVLEKSTLLETFPAGGVTNNVQVAALDTSDDGIVNYDTLVFFDIAQGIQPGPFNLPSTGPAYVKASEKRGSYFYLEGSPARAGCAFYVSRLEPNLSVVRVSRTSANSIPRNAAVLANVDDINNHVGFWAPQPDFRIPERISPGYGPFPDIELEEIYADLVRGFTDYQTRLALRAISQVPDADLVMIYFEQPDGSGHQFLLTDPRQPTDFLNPNSIGGGQDLAKVARYAEYMKFAYQTANAAVQRIIEAVGTDGDGKPKSNVIVTSDHGFEIFHTAVNMNALLAANGIPASKVRAVTSGPAVNIYLNLQGREPNGTVTREEYVTLQQQLASMLQGFNDTNSIYTLGAPGVSVFDKVYPRPLPADINDASFGRGTTEFIGQDSGDVYALLTIGYNFDGTQTPVIVRQGDTMVSNLVLSLPNFYGAHGYDPTLPAMSSILYAAGPDIGRGVLPIAHNIDLAPTIAAMLGVETYDAVDGENLPIDKLKLISVVSRKTHGNAGTFDLPLPLSGEFGIECRRSEAEDYDDDNKDRYRGKHFSGKDGGNHTLVLEFTKELAGGRVVISSSRGQVVGKPVFQGNQMIVRLRSVRDRQVLTLRLAGVRDVYGGKINATLRVGFLLGDATGDGVVNNADIGLVRASIGDVNTKNYRADAIADGTIDTADRMIVRYQLGNRLIHWPKYAGK